MSLLTSTLVLYLLIGLGIMVALFLSDPPRPQGERLLRLVTALPFWPFYLPILLVRPSREPVAGENELERTLAVVERELEAARSTLEEWIGITPQQERRLEQLRQAWQAQRERLNEMDRLLIRPEYALDVGETESSTLPRVQQSLAARQQNVQRLRQLRRQAEADLLASLACVRELASRIQLARFTNTSPTRAEELLAELAAAVEALCSPPNPESSHHFIKKAE